MKRAIEGVQSSQGQLLFLWPSNMLSWPSETFVTWFNRFSCSVYSGLCEVRPCVPSPPGHAFAGEKSNCMKEEIFEGWYRSRHTSDLISLFDKLTVGTVVIKIRSTTVNVAFELFSSSLTKFVKARLGNIIWKHFLSYLLKFSLLCDRKFHK